MTERTKRFVVTERVVVYTIKLVTLSHTHPEGNRKHRDKGEGGIYLAQTPLYNSCLLFIFKVKDLSDFVYRHVPVSSS